MRIACSFYRKTVVWMSYFGRFSFYSESERNFGFLHIPNTNFRLSEMLTSLNNHKLWNNNSNKLA